MKASLLISALFCLGHVLGATTEPAVGQSYQFSIPDDVSFESKTEHEFYTFRWGEAEITQLLMLYPRPVPSSPKMMGPMADMMAISFEENLPKDSGLSLKGTTRTPVELGPFTGTQLTFELEGPDGMRLDQLIYILHDGERIWNGQLSGNGEGGAKRAQAILSSATPVADAATEPAEDAATEAEAETAEPATAP